MNVTGSLARKGALVLWVALGALMAIGSNPLSAQTAEGRLITNIATATFTDANGNVYAAASGSVDVIVGFKGSLAVSSPASATPASPSSGNTVTWTITNNGNGSDQIQIDDPVTTSDPNVAGNFSFVYAGTPYATVALLNVRLLLVADSIPAAGAITIDVVYDVGAGEGGNFSDVELTATSTRTGGDSNSSVTRVTPDLSGSLSVTASNPTIDRLPSNGVTLYVESYDVTSGLTGPADIDLDATLDVPNAATVVITRIRESTSAWVAASSTSFNFLAGETRSIEVEYRVDGGVGDVGAQSTLTLTATANSVPGPPTDSDDHVVTIVTPILSVVKTVHATEADALAGAPPLSVDPQPGTTIWYRVEVTNSGLAPAVMTGGSNGISDDLTSLPVTYVLASLNQTGSPTAWTTLDQSGGIITGTIAGGLPGGGGQAWFVFAVTIN